jgi:hypothetical protein
MHGPNPETKHPMEGFPQVSFIRNTVRNPSIIDCPGQPVCESVRSCGLFCH